MHYASIYFIMLALFYCKWIKFKVLWLSWKNKSSFLLYFYQQKHTLQRLRFLILQAFTKRSTLVYRFKNKIDALTLKTRQSVKWSQYSRFQSLKRLSNRTSEKPRTANAKKNRTNQPHSYKKTSNSVILNVPFNGSYKKTERVKCNVTNKPKHQ